MLVENTIIWPVTDITCRLADTEDRKNCEDNAMSIVSLNNLAAAMRNREEGELSDASSCGLALLAERRDGLADEITTQLSSCLHAPHETIAMEAGFPLLSIDLESIEQLVFDAALSDEDGSAFEDFRQDFIGLYEGEPELKSWLENLLDNMYMRSKGLKTVKANAGIEFEQIYSDLPELVPPRVNNIRTETLDPLRGIYRLAISKGDCTLDVNAAPFYFFWTLDGVFEDFTARANGSASVVFRAGPDSGKRNARVVAGVGDNLGQVHRKSILLKRS